MASPVNALTGTSTPAATSSSSSGGLDPTSGDSEEVFLQLLVSQMQNQDPLNPTDSTQFVSELAQFSELEQTMAIRSDIESYAAQAPAAQTSSTTQT